MRTGLRAVGAFSLFVGLMGSGLQKVMAQSAVIGGAQHSSEATAPDAEHVHTDRTFEFTVKAPMESAAPLFGADKERSWSTGWDPAFVWPANVKDQPGTVFTVTRGERKSVWITTANDPANGFFQYAYVMPDVVATLITVKLVPQGATTHAKVRYERTALNKTANETVLRMPGHDSQSGPEWESEINSYLAGSKR